jgi:hypothetical protein
VTRFEPSPTLDVFVAERFLVPEIERLKVLVRDAARDRAPDGKVWVTARDERVRTTHRHADSQEIPANLRYVLRRPGKAPGTELARVPRDPNLSIGNAINCRCESIPLPGAVARTIHDGPTVIAGTRVRAEITCSYHRAAESEFGGDGDEGAHFMGGAIDEVAARTRGTSARRT